MGTYGKRKYGEKKENRRSIVPSRPKVGVWPPRTDFGLPKIDGRRINGGETFDNAEQDDGEITLRQLLSEAFRKNSSE